MDSKNALVSKVIVRFPNELQPLVLVNNKLMSTFWTLPPELVMEDEEFRCITHERWEVGLGYMGRARGCKQELPDGRYPRVKYFRGV